MKKDANSIATELGVTFQDNSEWVSQIHQYSKGTTTYFYYNNEHNDCVALTVNDTTNRIVGITYFYDFNKIMETIDRF